MGQKAGEYGGMKGETPLFEIKITENMVHAFNRAVKPSYGVAEAVSPILPFTFWQRCYPHWLQGLYNRTILGNVEISYTRPLQIGEILHDCIRLIGVEEKQGKKAPLTFALHQQQGWCMNESVYLANTLLIFPMSLEQTGLARFLHPQSQVYKQQQLKPAMETFSINGNSFTFPDRLVAEDDIHFFAEVTGDQNSIHLQEKEAQEAGFSRKPSHGLWQLGVTVEMLHTQLGEKAWFPYISARFSRPLFADDILTVSGTSHWAKESNFANEAWLCDWSGNKQSGELVLSGKTLALLEGKDR